MSDRSTENNSRNNAVDLPLRYFYPPRIARRIVLGQAERVESFLFDSCLLSISF